MLAEPKTVQSVLTRATDSVTLINSINSDASAEPYVDGMSQTEINRVVQKNVDHLELILEYTDPDVKGSSEDKSSYTSAIATGKAYIAAN